jgi:ABC-type dipeptide/oligopeptide/nickel transport system permease subunit
MIVAQPREKRRSTGAATAGWAAGDQSYLLWARATAISLLTLTLRLLRNPITLIAFLVLLTLIFVSVFAPWISPYDRLAIDSTNLDASPTLKHPFGTDEVGRDVLSRLMHAGRVSLSVALGAEGVALAIGVRIGLAAGFFRGAVDATLMRTMDSVLAFPPYLAGPRHSIDC